MSGFGSGHDLRVMILSPAGLGGSLLEIFSLSLCPSHSFLSQINKEGGRKKERERERKKKRRIERKKKEKERKEKRLETLKREPAYSDTPVSLRGLLSANNKIYSKVK